jgi:formylglycine-generating enzyme required for sulfatase activity
MKHLIKITALTLAFAAIALTGCKDGKGDNKSMLLLLSGGSGTTTRAAGDKVTLTEDHVSSASAGDRDAITADNVSFTMAYVPGGKILPTGGLDNSTATVSNAYWIGETEVTYELWSSVYAWATHDDRGANKYYFANAGRMGNESSGTGMTDRHPVTYINWRDCMVWCNAATEWYNAKQGKSYTCAYTYTGAIIRDSRDSNETACDNAVARSTASGFRLLTANEWELGARYRGSDQTNVVTATIDGTDFSNPADGIYWTKGNSASHAAADYNNAAETGAVAWYNANSFSTNEVKGKTGNALGLYDMSGNVWEWCFEPSGSTRLWMGGSFAHAALQQRIGSQSWFGPSTEDTDVGFRFARSAGVSFTMSYVPGGNTFPTGTNDEGSATVANAYWIGETEATYELWNKVRAWAVDTAVDHDGDGLTNAADGDDDVYTFAHAGVMGDGSGDTAQHPVTTVSWRSAMAWCNALTEWYNAQKGTAYSCVYYTDSGYTTPRRSVDGNILVGSTPGDQDNPYVKDDAAGFRLVTRDEWELAARYINGTNWLYGDHASGDESGACYDDGSILGGQSLSNVFGDYAVYTANSSLSTAAVKSKTANALGLYDMSGNVWEWCFDWYASGSSRAGMGGSWKYSSRRMQVGSTYFGDHPKAEYDELGFRFARSAE